MAFIIVIGLFERGYDEDSAGRGFPRTSDDWRRYRKESAKDWKAIFSDKYKSDPRIGVFVMERVDNEPSPEHIRQLFEDEDNDELSHFKKEASFCWIEFVQ